MFSYTFVHSIGKTLSVIQYMKLVVTVKPSVITSVNQRCHNSDDATVQSV